MTELIFSPWRIGELDLPNRLVRSATWEGLADDDGAASDRLGDLWAGLAAGGVGLIVAGYAHVLRNGQGLPGQTGIFADKHIAPLAGQVKKVHRAGGLISAQLAHAGRQTSSTLIGRPPLGPSAGFNQLMDEPVEELSLAQIEEIVAAFAAAATRVVKAGFDAVQLHGAHGYLISQFLSPAFNQRQDRYGGSLENRARFCLEVFEAVKQAVGPDFPVFIKLNTDDGLPGGFTLKEAVETARVLEAAGAVALEVSGGVAGGGRQYDNSPARVVRNRDEEGYFLANALAVKKAVACPVISVGGWRSPDLVEKALAGVDAVAMSRPLIREPGLAARWRAGDPAGASCISCGRCMAQGRKGGISCPKITKPKG